MKNYVRRKLVAVAILIAFCIAFNLAATIAIGSSTGSLFGYLIWPGFVLVLGALAWAILVVTE